MFSILLASFILLCMALTDNEQVLIQSHFSNRHEAGAMNVIGNLIGKLLLHSRIREGSFTNLVVQCNQTFLDAVTRQVFNSEGLKKLNIETGSFIFLNFTSIEMRPGAVRTPFVQLQPDANNRVESPLVCAIQEYTNTIVFNWAYHLAFFDFRMVQCMIERYTSILKKVLQSPDSLIEMPLKVENLTPAYHS